MDVKLKNLGQLIEECWNRAEGETAKAVAQKHRAPAEEEITFLFSGELRKAVEDASTAGRVEEAFRADLRQSIPSLSLDVTRYSSGLVARVNVHGRWHEGTLSAADFGLVITRPLVQLALGGTSVEFRRDHATGLLAQAKLGRQVHGSDGGHTWNGLTRPQVRLLPKRREYYSLLLYRLHRLEGQNADELKPFGWQLCKEHTVKQVQKWLRSDMFPQEISSSEVLQRLFARKIGTENPKIIETIIDPAGSKARSITLQIFWPDGGGPPPSHLLHRHQEKKQQAQQRIRQ